MSIWFNSLFQIISCDTVNHWLTSTLTHRFVFLQIRLINKNTMGAILTFIWHSFHMKVKDIGLQCCLHFNQYGNVLLSVVPFLPTHPLLSELVLVVLQRFAFSACYGCMQRQREREGRLLWNRRAISILIKHSWRLRRSHLLSGAN